MPEKFSNQARVVLIVEDEVLLRMNAAEMIGEADLPEGESFFDQALPPGANRRDASRIDRCRLIWR